MGQALYQGHRVSKNRGSVRPPGAYRIMGDINHRIKVKL